MQKIGNITHYNVTELDKKQLTSLWDPSNAININYIADDLSQENIDLEAEVISVFVTSIVTEAIMEAMPNLKLIICRSTGFNNVDLAAARSRNIVVCNVPHYGVKTVAEYAVGLILALVKRINYPSEPGTKVGSSSLRGMDIAGKTIGVVGTGAIGKHFISLIKSFGVKILAYDVVRNEAAADTLGFAYDTLDELLSKSDIISLHAPSTPETYHLLGKEQFEIIKPGSYIINTARGELIQTEALIQALQAGKLAGAALDVFEGEKLVWDNLTDHPGYKNALDAYAALKAYDQVILTPHNAFNTSEAIERINHQTIQIISDFTEGKELAQVV